MFVRASKPEKKNTDKNESEHQNCIHYLYKAIGYSPQISPHEKLKIIHKDILFEKKRNIDMAMYSFRKEMKCYHNNSKRIFPV